MSNFCVGTRAASAKAMRMAGSPASSQKHEAASPKPLMRDTSASTNQQHSHETPWTAPGLDDTSCLCS